MKTIIILAFVGLALGFPGTTHFFREINFTKIFVKMISRKNDIKNKKNFKLIILLFYLQGKSKARIKITQTRS